jgi:hypothetical protein
LLLVVIRAPWPSDKHSLVKILAAGELDATPASRNPFSLLIAVDTGAHRCQAFVVACRMALPLHLVVVTLWGSPIVAGELATTKDTHSRAPVPSSTSDRRASFFKFPATVDALYKLMVGVAALCHREALAPTPTRNRSPELWNFKLPPNQVSATAKNTSPRPALFRSVPIPCFLV